MKITETDNPNLEVKRVKMNVSNNQYDVEKPLQKGTFFYIISGQPNSGKTNLAMTLIKRRKKFYNKQFHKVYIFSPSVHTIGESLNIPKEQIIEGLDLDRLQEIIEEEKSLEDDEKNKCLFIFDDLVNMLNKDVKPVLHLIYNRRHIGGGCSIMFLTQKFNKLKLEYRSVATGIMLFQTKNKMELNSLFQEYIGVPRVVFQSILDYVFDKPHNFLYLNLLETEENMYHKNFNPLKIGYYDRIKED
jgi:AAA+ ATPase superfamily predicted ATPase